MKQKNVSPGEQFVEYALRIGALELVPEGRKLKSGRLSPYFFNSGKFDSSMAVEVIASAYAHVIGNNFQKNGRLTIDLLYGPPYKGTILVPTVALMINRLEYGNVRFCTSRKETKAHGEGGLFIGAPITPGARVLILDDVTTDGGTKREAVELIRRHGGVPVGLCIAFDRQERGEGSFSASQEFQREYKIPVHAVATRTDLISFLERGPSQGGKGYGKMLGKMRTYSREYGVE